MTAIEIARRVVIRHTCHCDGAAEQPDADHPEQHHTFRVDDKEFPWLISERGPIPTRVGDQLYLIDVEIVLWDLIRNKYIPFSYSGPGATVPYLPIIGTEEFPWLCDDSGCHLSFSVKQLPMLKLRFFSHFVSGNIAIEDKRLAKDREEIWSACGVLLQGERHV